MTIDRFHNLPFTLRQLQYTVAVAETGGFGRAAEAAAVSQPSLSAQVAKLEEGLGVQLFERHARGVHLTRAGEALLPSLQAVLQAAQEARGVAQTQADPSSLTLRLAVIPTIAPYLLPPAVEGLRARQGSPRIHWVELQTSVAEAELGAGHLDAALMTDPPTLPSVDHVELGWEPFLLVAPEDSPLRGPVTLAQVAEHEVLLLEDGHCLRDHTMKLCMLPGARESEFRATSLPTLVQMVASGLGVSVLPASAVPVEAHRARVRVLPFLDPEVGRTQRLCWRARSPHTSQLRALAGVLRQALARALESHSGPPRSEGRAS